VHNGNMCPTSMHGIATLPCCKVPRYRPARLPLSGWRSDAARQLLQKVTPPPSITFASILSNHLSKSPLPDNLTDQVAAIASVSFHCAISVQDVGKHRPLAHLRKHEQNPGLKHQTKLGSCAYPHSIKAIPADISANFRTRYQSLPLQ
jgi:hypothetical protein